MYLSAVSSVDACLRPNCDSRSLHIFSGICSSGMNDPVLPTWGINWLFSVLVAHTGMCAVSQLGVHSCHGAETLVVSSPQTARYLPA